MLTNHYYQPTTLARIAPRLGAALDAIEKYEMRGIKRCTCGMGWRIIEYEYGNYGCFDVLIRARAMRDSIERTRMWEIDSRKYPKPQWMGDNPCLANEEIVAILNAIETAAKKCILSIPPTTSWTVLGSRADTKSSGSRGLC